MQPIPYLFFKGTCEEALRAYQRVFAAPEPQVMRASEAPAGDAAAMSGDPNAIMHAALQVGEGWIYASDYSDAKPMAGSAVTVSLPDAGEARRVFDALAEGGRVDMPFAATFWSAGFGGVTDRWGTVWLVDTETPRTAS